MSKGLECYFGTDVWSGSVRMLVPTLFAAEIYNDSKGTATIRTISDSEIVDEMSQMVIQNNLPYREAIMSEDIHKGYVSKKVVKKIKRYLMAGEEEKARKKIWGYSWARLMDYMAETEEILDDNDSLGVGYSERREMTPFMAFGYKVDEQYVFNIPDNLFAILNKGGPLEIVTQPEFLQGEAKRNFLENQDNPGVTKFTVSRRTLDDLEKACFEGDITLRNVLVSDIVKWAVPLIDKNYGD